MMTPSDTLAAQGAPGAASDAAATGTGEATGRSVNQWAFAAIAVVMASLVAIVWIVLARANSQAPTILGVVIPVFATIGAAVFGVNVGYQQGASAAEQKAEQRTGEEVARAEAAAAVAEKSKLLPDYTRMEATVGELKKLIETAGQSEAGTSGFHLTAPSGSTLTVPADLLSDVDRSLGAMRASLGVVSEP